METNWNQLIELYLQNELSEEGRAAFEQQLQGNPELREELEMHQLIQSAAKRASQRLVIKQTGQSYLRNLRIKQFTIGVVVTAATSVGIIYWTQNKKRPETAEPKKEFVVENKLKEVNKEMIPSGDTLINQPTQTGDKSSLIQSSDWKTVGDKSSESKVSLASNKPGNKVNQPVFTANKNGKAVLTKVDLKMNRNKLTLDTVSLVVKPTKVLAYTNDKLEGRVIESKEKETTNSRRKNSSLEGAAWELQYDSIGHFNDLYCGYALVMDDSKFGFVDRKGNIFIPLIYDKIVVTSSIQSSKNRVRRKDKKVLYIPKRSGNEVQYCEENIHPLFETDSNKVK